MQLTPLGDVAFDPKLDQARDKLKAYFKEYGGFDYSCGSSGLRTKMVSDEFLDAMEKFTV